jgi:hypothetical protein
MGAGVGDMRIYVEIWLDAFVRSFAVLTTAGGSGGCCIIIIDINFIIIVM